ncbi:MAG: glycosyltransferase family 4 protein [Planctomycetota bacterium]|nr:glycosyltransferase family 4 protein [Planctomycetota bacterium]
MKIALVHLRHAQVGGTERVLNEVSRRLAVRGHDVTVVCRSHVEPAHPAIQFRVLKSPVIGSAWRMWAFAGDVERHLRETSYDLVYSLGRTWSQDVIRCSGGSHSIWLEQVRVARKRERRLMPHLSSIKDHLAVVIERRAYAPGAYRRVIVNSKLVGRDLAQRYAVPPESLDLVYNGVDLQRFHPVETTRRIEIRKGLGASAEDVLFLFLGKGFERKGLDRLIRGFVAVASREARARLSVVGRDSNQAQYEKLAADLGIGDRVRFHGERRDPELCLAAADVHVLPTWYDSFGFTVLESLACGTPAITTDHAGASELVDSGVHGDVLRADCGPEAISASLLSWCDEDRRRQARVHARTRAEGFGFDSTMERMIEILENVERAKRGLSPKHVGAEIA